MPGVSAAIAGTRMQLARPCSICAAIAGTRVGNRPIITALTAKAAKAQPISNRRLGSVSINMPAGSWPIMPEIVPTLSTSPISRCDRPDSVSQTETNGPKPVCTAASRKLSALSAIRLWRDVVKRSAAGRKKHGALPQIPLRDSRPLEPFPLRDAHPRALPLARFGAAPHASSCLRRYVTLHLLLATRASKSRTETRPALRPTL